MPFEVGRGKGEHAKAESRQASFTRLRELAAMKITKLTYLPAFLMAAAMSFTACTAEDVDEIDEAPVPAERMEEPVAPAVAPVAAPTVAAPFAPALDADRDGILDPEEGLGDADRDGVLDRDETYTP